jgi:flavorubredoxin
MYVKSDVNRKYNLLKDAVLLIAKGQYQIYWIGSVSNQVLRSNIYLIKDKNEGMVIDCGSRAEFNDTINRVKQILPLSKITRIFVNHQDPDVTSSIVDWLHLNPNIEILTSPHTNVLIQHYLDDDREFKFYNTVTKPYLKLNSGGVLEFIPSPFLHSPGAVTIYDHSTRTLFSGDIWSAISLDWELVFDGDFREHIESMDFFHKDYLASNKASRNFLLKLKNRPIYNIMPQHGSILTREYVKEALKYLKYLKCGTDYFREISDEELDFID